jgi:hypothetical protein
MKGVCENASDMCAKIKWKWLMLSAALLGGPYAYADNAGMEPGPSPQSPSNRPAPRIDYLSNGLFSAKTMAPTPEPAAHNEVQDAPGKTPPPITTPTNGLHWEASDQHPALEYRFSDQTSVHFHVARHGITESAVWKF